MARYTFFLISLLIMFGGVLLFLGSSQRPVGSISNPIDPGTITSVGTLTGLTVSGDIVLQDDVDLALGTGSDGLLRLSSSNAHASSSNEDIVLALSDSNQAFHITDKGAVATDWNLADDTHPTLYIHSNTTPATDYISIGNHDGSTAEINVVGGTLDILIGGTIETRFTSSGINLISGNSYFVNGGSVLNNDTLGTGVLTSSLTTVGALDSGSITDNFGNIDIGTSNITTGGALTIDAVTGTIDFTAATSSIPFPVDANCYTNSQGETCLDTTSNQLQINIDGTNTRIIQNHRHLRFEYATSTAWSGTTTLNAAPADEDEELLSIQCDTIDAGTLDILIGDGTNWTTLFQASTTVGRVTFTSNNTFVEGENIQIKIGNPASSPVVIACNGRMIDTIK